MQTIITTILLGLFLGLLISVPMGPVGILCVHRTLHDGRKAGMLTGIGATVADLFYAISTFLITYKGMTYILDWVDKYELVFQGIGVSVILILGIYMYYSNPARNLKETQKASGPWQILGSSFLIAIGNPLIIFVFITFFSRYALFEEPIDLWLLLTITMLSVAGGAISWWSFITYCVKRLRDSFTIGNIRVFNKIVALVVITFAVAYTLWIVVQAV
ncbi:LysE family translocator [Porphyromonas circumdentaria]|uniref:Threonine/homoserine/homoserine lactone efflux protein n=1 Tax=Porphyromonas circumdentaria TaxID=29524 RepID=A0A1T4PTS9_9PORP|nr:LysE family transporter [Porphyromonas circumdentaria]MBB6276534.1 threonine/homoserine/homoserine lactone efflux protein [Porphyromonas circumdentaria]MDO4722821.1 LysE family transporter [Porphyromonas circumdentaria]SJZ94923.1 Threonine/homoserine/homoserine lactone efflux protein [Porphyromonas circumdentaria]